MEKKITPVPPNIVNQMVLATVAGNYAGDLTDLLVGDGFYVTQVNSSGGFLHEATITLLIGLDKIRLPHLLEHIRTCCRTHRQFLPAQAESPFLEIPPVMIEVEVGGAMVYVVDVERFEQL